MNLNFNKKGNVISDVILLVVVLFIISLTVFISFKFMDDMNEEIQSDSDMNNVSKESSQESTTRFPLLFDGLILTVLILIWILLIVASFNIDAHPIFFAVMIILFIFVIVITIDLSNSFEEITEDEELVEYKVDFPITVWIFNNLIKIVIAFGATIMLVLYGKMRMG
jgi:hypothetical protein